MSYRATYVVRPDMDAATAAVVQALNDHARAHEAALEEVIAHCKRFGTSAALYTRAGWLQGQVYADGHFHLSLAPQLPTPGATEPRTEEEPRR
jgi:hypothetical protein